MIELLADGMKNFADKCIKDLSVNRQRVNDLLNNSLMLVTALNPHIGYDNAAKIAKIAFKENISFLQGCEMKAVNAFFVTDGRDSIKQTFNLSVKESLVINTREDFELALVLKKKENNLVLLKNNIN